MTLPRGVEVSASQSDTFSVLGALTVRDDDSREEAAGLETGGDLGDQDQEGQHHDQSGFILAKCVGVLALDKY